jgi:hypothetical protein
VSLWAIHFDPCSTDATLQLLHSDRLVQAAKDAGVTTILCGHTHESKVKPLSDTTTIYVCGTTCQARRKRDDPPVQNDCQILQIDVDSSTPTAQPALEVCVTWYRYDYDQSSPSFGEFRRLSAD